MKTIFTPIMKLSLVWLLGTSSWVSPPSFADEDLSETPTEIPAREIPTTLEGVNAMDLLKNPGKMPARPPGAKTLLRMQCQNKEGKALQNGDAGYSTCMMEVEQGLKNKEALQKRPKVELQTP